MTDVGTHQPSARGRTPERVMDALLDLLVAHRLRDVTLEDVAERAAVSRQTVYRHFGSRDGLIRAVVVREETRLAGRAREAVANVQTLDRAVVRAVTALLTGVREHPLIDRLIADDPETILPYLTLGKGPVLSTAGTIVGELVRHYAPVDDVVVDELAEVLSRLVISYTVAPGHRTPEEVGALAARLVRGGLLPQAPAGDH